MSGETRAHHRRSSREAARRALSDHDEQIMAGWCDAPEYLPEIRRLLHDNLIAGLGPRRRSGVRWTQHEGEDALAALSILLQTAKGEHADYYRQLRGKVREFGGWIVIAYAEAVE